MEFGRNVNTFIQTISNHYKINMDQILLRSQLCTLKNRMFFSLLLIAWRCSFGRVYVPHIYPHQASYSTQLRSFVVYVWCVSMFWVLIITPLCIDLAYCLNENWMQWHYLTWTKDINCRCDFAWTCYVDFILTLWNNFSQCTQHTSETWHEQWSCGRQCVSHDYWLCSIPTNTHVTSFLNIKSRTNFKQKLDKSCSQAGGIVLCRSGQLKLLLGKLAALQFWTGVAYTVHAVGQFISY